MSFSGLRIFAIFTRECKIKHFLADNQAPTIDPEHQRCRWPLNAAFGDGVGHHACVVAHIRRNHLGDVEVACLLRHEASRVLGDKRRVLVEDPREGEFCPNTKQHLGIICTRMQKTTALSAVPSLQC